jgi:ADP-ribose pyrophosphatase YjhB (NUDIX family)
MIEFRSARLLGFSLRALLLPMPRRMSSEQTVAREDVKPKPGFLGRLRPNRLLTAMFRPFWRMRRGLTLGAQGAVIDEEGRVLLVRHGYRPGWWFPGGGVEWGETLLTALARELEEEVGVTLTGEPELHGIFSNFASFQGDHIAVFVVRHWQRQGDFHKFGEIAEARMFAFHELPERIDPGTRARLAEILEQAPIRPLW